MSSRFFASLVLLIGLTLSPVSAVRTGTVIAPRQDAGVVLVDHFENATSATFVSGSLAYVGGLPGLGHAADFTSGIWLRYNLPSWYTGPWNTSSGTIDIFVYPTAYGTHLADINWYATTSEPGSGHVFHLFVLADGHVHVGFWPSYGFNSAGTIPLNRWTHIWVTWGDAGTRLYLNNVLDTSLPDRRVPGLNAMNYLYIPAWSVPGIGYVDELRIRSGWNVPNELRVTTGAALPDGMAGQPYAAQLEATGGLPPYAWAVSSGELPAGLALDPASGLISGVPTSAGTVGFSVRVTDALNVSTQDVAFTILVPNQPPTVQTASPVAVDEGEAVNLSASGTDPEGNPLTYDWDLDGDGVFETLGQEVTFSAANLDGPAAHAIAVRATDPEGLSGQASGMVSVANVNPAVSTPVAPMEPVQVNTAINTTAAFVDPGRLDTHSASWSWDDGATSVGVIQEVNGAGTALGGHSYAVPGVYEIGVTVTDKDGGTGQSIFQYVTVFDPDGGFVTGGGWIDSPAGAYVADAALAGKANFGFVSRYTKGATVPTGQTEFQFKTAGLDFHSTSYQWLVVAGPKAQFKGLGTINGAGAYGFMLTAVDGQINGGGGVDKFRVKIWDAATGVILYDNQLGSGEDAVPSTALGGGSIVVHK